MTFKSIYKKISEKMQEKGQVVTLSQEFTYNFNHQLAKGLLPIKEEFYRKSTASRNYINNLESKTAEV